MPSIPSPFLPLPPESSFALPDWLVVSVFRLPWEDCCLQNIRWCFCGCTINRQTNCINRNLPPGHVASCFKAESCSSELLLIHHPAPALLMSFSGKINHSQQRQFPSLSVYSQHGSTTIASVCALCLFPGHWSRPERDGEIYHGIDPNK